MGKNSVKWLDELNEKLGRELLEANAEAMNTLAKNLHQQNPNSIGSKWMSELAQQYPHLIKWPPQSEKK